jgi:protein gp37
VIRIVEELIEKPLRWRKPQMIFVNSMSDLFHEAISDADIGRNWSVMERADWHIYQILTKRPERMIEWMNRYNIVARPHIWLGVSAEDQKTFDYRVPFLFKIKAAIRWVSLEPLLGPITLTSILDDQFGDPGDRHALDWIVVGGESGRHARPMEFEWVRALCDEAVRLGIPFFFKQMGSVLARRCGYRDKGGDPAQWPADLRIREYPPNTIKKE